MVVGYNLKGVFSLNKRPSRFFVVGLLCLFAFNFILPPLFGLLMRGRTPYSLSLPFSKPKILINTLCINGDKSVDCGVIKKNREAYARNHGYHVFVQNKRDKNTKNAPWQKIKDFKKVSKGYDWVWILNADSLIMNKHASIHSLLKGVNDQHTGDLDVVISKDCNGYSTDSFLLRNSPWTHGLIDQWLVYEDDARIPNMNWWCKFTSIEL
jgi:hypothetical protein